MTKHLLSRNSNEQHSFIDGLNARRYFCLQMIDSGISARPNTQRVVPVSKGSPEFTTTHVPGFQITELWLPPGLTIQPHIHDRACFAVMLAGSFDVDFTRTSRQCTPSTAITEPQGERHRNRVMSAGARVLVVQPDPELERTMAPFKRLFGEITHVRHPGIGRLAWSMTGEIRHPDAVSSLALEGLALHLLSSASRESTRTRQRHQSPEWPNRLRDFLHDRFLESLSLQEIAAEFDVHPVHLSRAFRARFGTTVAGYLRDLRLDWAAARLADSDDSLAMIAARAGFSDQSHFTRVFKRFAGRTPGQFRNGITKG